MTNTNTKTTAASKWTMNETQSAFIAELGNYPEGITLFELKLAGKEFKSGSINALIAKGYIITDGDRTFDCDITFNGQTVGRMTKTGKIYRLAK